MTFVAAGCRCSTPVVEDAGTCTAGGACTPTEACRTGVVVCTSGVATCPASGSLANGTACGAGHVCSGGACAACAAGGSCSPTNPCHQGTVDCSTGAATCADSNVAVDAGAPCGTNQVCSASGACTACTANQACAPANACHHGATSCATGASTCADTNVPVDAGTACGSNQVCTTGGACAACTANVSCSPADPCHVGATTCATGTSTCADTGQLAAAGTACGSNLVCSSTGACGLCVANVGCAPVDACHQGLTSCASGGSVCVDTNVALDAGTSCGTGQVCSTGGACIGCDAGQACAPSAECRVAQLGCSTGAPVCADTGAELDGTGCDGGSCYGGGCRAALVISTTVNLSTDTLTAGRTCAEAPAWPVTTLGAGSADLATAPDAGCLAPGDRVLLINLQGTPTDFANVGNYELLTVATVAGSSVTFTAAPTRAFGPDDGGVSGLSVDGGVKVALQRVPELGDVVITDAGLVTAGAFNGLTGGVVALRALSLVVDGTVTASALGYRNGDWSQDDSDCSDSLQTGSGESFSGPSEYTLLHTGGGAGGIGPASGSSYNANDPLNASAGHSDAGQPGANGNARTIGEPGVAYGAPGGTRLTMGSGAAGNVTCTTAFSGPPRLVPEGNSSGGIVYLAANQLTVSSSGRVSADAVTLGRSTAPSGGYVLLRARQLDLGTNRVTADGMLATSISTLSNFGSAGYVALHYVTGVSGTTSPPATTTVISAP